MDKEKLKELYIDKRFPVSEIAKKYAVSQNKINYWLSKYEIKKRTISEAMYVKLNPDGDPFYFRKPRSKKDWMLYGLGLGLFWGEGNKKSISAVRLGNTDPGIIRVFLRFLTQFFSVDKQKLRYGLQVFSDISPEVAKKYWIEELKVSQEQFYKVTVTRSSKLGTYRHKNINGVLTVYFSNTRLKKVFDELIENIESM
ncbi:MAG: hypothetical protein HYT68_01310 [Candidatus Zambryskibacteria bacterium]|nr:hypothetical protein [Candidatus Zambryskibacteria bacterium]